MSLLSVRSLCVSFETSGGTVHAVNDVSFEVRAGETVGLVGESGCGKSTLGKAIMRLVPTSNGRIVVDGTDITTFSPRAMRPVRSKVQMIFQDPYGSINPRRTVGDIIGQPLSVAGLPRREIRERVDLLMEQVGLSPDGRHRYPHEFSGGQRQRIGIARALALDPQLLVCDEPVSALDVSVRAQVINLLADLQAARGVAYLFISHDLSVIEHVSDRLLVMYLGRIVESGPTAEIWAAPAHPYTKALIASAPLANPKEARRRPVRPLDGELPSPLHPPPGCAFNTRCPFAQARCRSERPLLRAVGDGRQVACHFDLAGTDIASAPRAAATEPAFA